MDNLAEDRFCIMTKATVPQGIDEATFNQFIKTSIGGTSREVVNVFLNRNTELYERRNDLIDSLMTRYLEMWRGTLTFDRFDPAKPVLRLIGRRSNIAPEGFTLDFMWSKED